MDNTPDYMKALPHVAQMHGGTTSMTFVGTLLRKQWDHFETLAKSKTYDIFVSVHLDYSGIRRAMQDLVETLYRVTGANWHTDVEQIEEKNREYGGSWHRRGGTGAFFMLSRKWDRIDVQLSKHNNDLAAVLHLDQRVEGILDDIGDLRRYLLLVLSWLQAQDNPVPVAVPVGVREVFDEPGDHQF